MHVDEPFLVALIEVFAGFTCRHPRVWAIAADGARYAFLLARRSLERARGASQWVDCAGGAIVAHRALEYVRIVGSALSGPSSAVMTGRAFHDFY